jgi:2-polyprenyl-6-hydroxyphenyl methylase/3-demethylubiquinone-9 3-methyltransferase
MTALILVPLVLQGAAMAVDELVFHRRRGLPRWERIGHPLDTLTIIACIAWLLAGGSLTGYVVLAVFSTLFVTKDEWIHAEHCSGGEQWLHAVLFILHPVSLAALGFAASLGLTGVLTVQLALACALGGYQVIYWNLIRGEARVINNEWYADLGARWYVADDTPIALLRAEARHRNPWLAERIGLVPQRIVDLGCGAGLLANDLAARGHDVLGVDTTPENLAIAATHGEAEYLEADARAVPLADGTADVVTAMDLLEHVEDPGSVVAEASRLLGPGGTFYFHTFNRTWLASFVVVKGVEWFVANTPKDLHVSRLFIRPDELRAMCEQHGLEIVELHGVRPRFGLAMLRMLVTGRVSDAFTFTFTRSLSVGYLGVARKRAGVCSSGVGGTPLRALPRDRDAGLGSDGGSLRCSR